MLPKVEAGTMTMQEAMLSAGYAESSARQQTTTLNSLKNNDRMRDAFEKAGITLDSLAKKYAEGLNAKGAKGRADYNTRYKYVAAATQILDCYPSQKVEVSGNPDRPLFNALPDTVKQVCAEITASVECYDS